ncbi:zf-HC2 domain-containing protein [Jatrophihabitans telluris]|uniref:Zf-HC2 domain-containing protein n=1 Tax=Jatrophihabitans telluris TaxID=2038343 RepID=A0ABY4R0F8_9ACTN|nr:zf-HC2 domain-containing protein [Jatrophihabitans telluris]UQX89273.1 zf-HC2 domain-containing protein [Jatrophihabitans telluris]
MKRSFHRDELACRRAVELISDYLDEALASKLRRRLEQHLAKCPHCAAYLAQIRAVIAAVGPATVDEIDPLGRDEFRQLYRRTVR